MPAASFGQLQRPGHRRPSRTRAERPLAVRAQEEEHRELALLDRFLHPVRHSIDVAGHEVEHRRTDRIDVPPVMETGAGAVESGQRLRD